MAWWQWLLLIVGAHGLTLWAMWGKATRLTRNG